MMHLENQKRHCLMIQAMKKRARLYRSPSILAADVLPHKMMRERKGLISNFRDEVNKRPHPSSIYIILSYSATAGSRRISV